MTSLTHISHMMGVDLIDASHPDVCDAMNEVAGKLNNALSFLQVMQYRLPPVALNSMTGCIMGMIISLLICSGTNQEEALNAAVDVFDTLCSRYELDVPHPFLPR